jgi:hypothetical protein
MGDPFGVDVPSHILSAGRTDLRQLRGDTFSVFQSQRHEMIWRCSYPNQKGSLYVLFPLRGLEIKAKQNHIIYGFVLFFEVLFCFSPARVAEDQ